MIAIVFGILFGILFGIWLLKCRKLTGQVAERDREIERIQVATQVALQESQALSAQQIAEYQQYAEQIRSHYEAEARRMYDQMMVTFQEQSQRIESLQRFELLEREEAEVKHSLILALRQAEALQAEAQAIIDEAKRHAEEIAGKPTPCCATRHNWRKRFVQLKMPSTGMGIVILFLRIAC